MKLINLPRIIAVTALAVLLTVLGSACATAQKKPPTPPLERVYDSAVPEDRRATLFIPPGYVEVFEFDGKPLDLDHSVFARIGTNLAIPAGDHNVRFHFRGGAFNRNDATNMSINFKAVAGRAYVLSGFLTSASVIFRVFEGAEMREPGPDEQLLFVKMESSGDLILILDKGTNDERLFYLTGGKGLYSWWTGYAWNETRIVVPQGEHTIDVQNSPTIVAMTNLGLDVKPDGDEQPRIFTASSEPVRYSIAFKWTEGKNAKRNYVLTMQLATGE